MPELKSGKLTGDGGCGERCQHEVTDNDPLRFASQLLVASRATIGGTYSAFSQRGTQNILMMRLILLLSVCMAFSVGGPFMCINYFFRIFMIIVNTHLKYCTHVILFFLKSKRRVL